MKLSDFISSELLRIGISTVFGYTGGSIADIIDSIYLSKIEFVSNYHEQASSFAANAYAQITLNIGVAVSSSGPGACNLINGIANSYFDSIPCVFITGNVHSKSAKISNEIRQNSFQETDIVTLVSEITKFSIRITNPQDIRYFLEKAFYIAKSGRPGPVLLDIPYDVARADIDTETLKGYTSEIKDTYDEYDTGQIKELLKTSRKPLILLGGGTKSAECRKKIIELLGKVEIPVVASLCGLDVLAHNHKCFLGFIGHYGNRYANLAITNCDLLIIVGSRLDERQLAGIKEDFASEAKIIHIDIDKNILDNKNWNTPEIALSIHSSAEIFFTKFNNENFEGLDYSNWFSVLTLWKKRYPSFNLNNNIVNANDFLHAISDYLPDNAIICSDVGQNQMCVAQSIKLDDNRKLLNSGGYGSMGFSLPAAIGASYASKGTKIISINGDGGIQMNIQELQTIVRDNLPINIIILNNNCLGMIRRLQEKMFDNRTFASVKGYSTPDYSKIAEAYGIEYLKIDSVSKYILVKDFISNKEPCLIEVLLPMEMQNIPEPGTSICKQFPLLSDEENTLIKKESSL